MKHIESRYEELERLKNENKPKAANQSNIGSVKNPWHKDSFNLTQQGKMLKENPVLAKQMQSSIRELCMTSIFSPFQS